MSDFNQEIKKIFSKGGLLSFIEGFEYRKPQQEMAIIIAESLESGTHCIVEAPTGVGKSFAYLVPSILYSLKEKRKAIVSTCTINLQEQLIKKDIPALADILPHEFRSEILKGRNNYICTRRLNNAMIKKDNLFGIDEQVLLQDIYNFVQKTGKGTLQEIPFKVEENVWSEIFAEEGICTSKSCGAENSNCYYQQAKVRLKQADLIVLNHYLFFTLFGLYEFKTNGYIFTDDFVIFDEAHQIEQIASENISPSVSKEQVKFWLHKLYNPKNDKGFFTMKRFSSGVNLIRTLLNDNDTFFEDVQNYVFNLYKKDRNKSPIRIREPLEVRNSLDVGLLELYNELKKITSYAKNDDEENEIKNYAKKISSIRITINDFLNQKLDEHVYWIDFSGRSRKNVMLCMSPIDMAEFFRNNVFTEDKQCIMTSATLSINKSLSYFQKSVGAEHVDSHIMGPVFDYKKQMTVYIPRWIPEPSHNKYESISDFFVESEYEKALNSGIKEYIKKTGGGALVLFTNLKMLRKIHNSLLNELNESGIEVYAQGEGLSKTRLLNEFRKNRNSVLFGVDSFWMGVDVPGESLRNVIITKLPFDVPDHPVVEAKIELIEKRGGNPFIEYSLPGAILKLRQGIGRLIRNKTDKGIVVILDSRILSKAYGKQFISSLPECEVVVE